MLRAFMAGACRTQSVEAQPPGDHRQPAANIGDVVEVRSRQPQKRLLRDILGLADIAEHLVREVHQVGAMAAPCRLDCR